MKTLKKKPIITVSYFFLFFVFSSALSFTQAFSAPSELDIKTSVDKEVVKAGETFTYVITISGNRMIDIDIPDFGDQIGDFAVEDSNIKENIDGDRKIIEKWYTLKAEKPGTYKIPGIALTYKFKGETKITEARGVNITVKPEKSQVSPQDSSAQQDESEDIRDIKSLQEIAVPLSWYLIGIGIIAFIVIIALLISYFMRRKKNKIPPPLPPIPPREAAIEAIKILKRENYLDRGLYKMFHYKLSEIFRTYLEARFSFPATDLTTEEIIPLCKNNFELSEKNHTAVNDVLKETDLVKFADTIPTKDRSLELLDSVTVFIEETYRQVSKTEQRGGDVHEV